MATVGGNGEELRFLGSKDKGGGGFCIDTTQAQKRGGEGLGVPDVTGFLQ